MGLSECFGLAAIPVGIFGPIGGFKPSNLALSYILGLFLVQLLRSGLGEEPGWRGFLLPRLKARFERDKSVWILGLIWSIWHFPIIIIQTLSMMPDVEVPELVITLVMQLAGNVMALVGMTYIYVWLYNNTQSVFLSIVFHALSNIFVFWLLSFLETPQMASLAIALMPWAVVIFLRKKWGKINFLEFFRDKSIYYRLVYYRWN